MSGQSSYQDHSFESALEHMSAEDQRAVTMVLQSWKGECQLHTQGSPGVRPVLTKEGLQFCCMDAKEPHCTEPIAKLAIPGRAP